MYQRKFSYAVGNDIIKSKQWLVRQCTETEMIEVICSTNITSINGSPNRGCRSQKQGRIVAPSEIHEVSDAPHILNTRKDAARQLSISVRSIDYLIAEGRIRAKRIGGRVLITTKELYRFATDDQVEPLVPHPLPHAA
jgi:excisionase family DNA binding protein